MGPQAGSPQLHECAGAMRDWQAVVFGHGVFHIRGHFCKGETLAIGHEYGVITKALVTALWKGQRAIDASLKNLLVLVRPTQDERGVEAGARRRAGKRAFLV